MPGRSWKHTERQVARILGGERVPVSGRTRGDVPDIAHDRFSVEVKMRSNLPVWLLEAMEQAEKAVRGERIPVVVIHHKGKPYEEDLVLLRMKHFRTIAGLETREKEQQE